MTVKEMRSLMLQKVVPENVIPQNVVEFLIDENAELPEPDAFTFLTRLRALGICSADFLYLLEGCGAPQSAVDKIKANPAMNLQTLILTLDSSGLTSKDYTRMLYTARQIWERTLTLRLERSELLSEAGYSDENELSEEPSFAEVLEEIAEDVRFDDDDVRIYGSGGAAEDEREESGESASEEFPEEYAVEQADGDFDMDDLQGADLSEDFFDDSDYYSDGDFTGELDTAKSEDEPFVVNIPDEEPPAEEASQPYTGDTTVLIKIDRELLKHNLAKLAEEAEEAETPKSPEIAAGAAAAQRPRTSEAAPRSEAEKTSEASGYHKAALIASAAGAAALIGFSAVAGRFARGAETKKTDFASDSGEVFEAIYYAYDDYVYNGGIAGGEGAREYAPDHNEIFGDLLVCGDAPGVFSEGNSVYRVTYEAVSAKAFENGALTPLGELLPPKGTRFVAAFGLDDALIALFSGSECGYMKISGGKTRYTVRQDGFLTDFEIADGEIRLGSVYTPKFSRTFKAEAEEIYLPKLGKEEMKPISAQSVILSGTKGFSYAVSASYSSENGDNKTVCAALGDPVFADADGKFAMNGEDGLLIRVNNENETGGRITAEKAELLLDAAFFENGCATYEDNSIMLRGKDLKPVVRLENLTQNVSSMRFSGNVLVLSGSESVFLTVDCSDPSAPKRLEMKRLNGVVSGESAFTAEIGADGLTLARYTLDNGAAKRSSEYTKQLKPEELNTLVCGVSETMLAGKEQCCAAYSYFDGVSVVSECVMVGAEPKTVTLFDDKTGFDLVFQSGGKIYAVCGDGVKDIANCS